VLAFIIESSINWSHFLSKLYLFILLTKHCRVVYHCMLQRLPLEELYAPPINICVRDNRQFGRKPVVGVHAVKSLQPYRHQPAAAADTELDSISKPPATGQLRFLSVSSHCSISNVNFAASIILLFRVVVSSNYCSWCNKCILIVHLSQCFSALSLLIQQQKGRPACNSQLQQS